MDKLGKLVADMRELDRPIKDDLIQDCPIHVPDLWIGQFNSWIGRSSDPAHGSPDQMLNPISSQNRGVLELCVEHPWVTLIEGTPLRKLIT